MSHPGPAWLLTLLLGSAALLPVACTAREPADWEAVKENVRRRFPSVEQLTTADLAAWLADPQRPAPLLLDARAPEEYAVSHLEGAVPAPDLEAARAALAAEPDRPVVVYCSVGWRSSALAERLERAGAAEVYNLEGSIFEWANEGREVVRGGEPVEEVHPFDEEWGRLLRRELWATAP